MAAYRYGFPLDVLIQQLKYGEKIVIAAWLADTFVARLGDAERPDLIVAMPLHRRRLSERGYNQATLLAARLAARLNISFDSIACRRERDTPPQVDLPYDKRHANIRGAFSCAANLTGLHVAIVDDVMTTGASLDELARVLRQAGAKTVSAWVMARAIKR